MEKRRREEGGKMRRRRKIGRSRGDASSNLKLVILIQPNQVQTFEPSNH